MQQATLAKALPTSVASGEGEAPASTAASNAFVINLVSSTTPVALTRPDHAGLNRFTFFVSRRREDGRERFRLHMGYFDTQEEAERLLDIVRGIYPGAWAGLAPGRKLSAAMNAAEPHAGSAAASSRPALASASAGAVAIGPTAINRSAVVPADPVRSVPASIETSALALVPDEGRRLVADVTENSARLAATRSLRNVRATIAALDDTGNTALMPRAIPELPRTIPELKAAVIPTVQPPAAPVPKSAPPAADARVDELSDSAALRVLETDAAAPTERPKQSSAPSPPAAAPPATQGDAHRSTQHTAPSAERPYFAVQLMWSVQPIAMTQVPQLAIFSAYTLYGAEGNRDGRRWYGLRLGFFTDAMSAKQVAHYVRADFSTVSVVPVTARERERAGLAAKRPLEAAGQAIAANGASAGGRENLPVKAGVKSQPKEPEFAFIDDHEALVVQGAKPGGVDARGKAPVAGAARPGMGTRPGGGTRPTRGAPGKRAKVRPPGQIHARARASARTLEETLEILGANELKVNDEVGLSTSDSGIRHLSMQSAKVKPSKLSRLFERLSERLGN